MAYKKPSSNYEFFDKNFCQWLKSYFFSNKTYIEQNKQKIKDEIEYYKSYPIILKNIIIESKAKKEAVENELKILTSITSTFYILLAQSFLTIFIFYISNINSLAVNIISDIISKKLNNINMNSSMDHNKFLDDTKKILSSFNEGMYPLIKLLLIVSLLIILPILLFIYITASRKQYYIEMYNYQILYCEKLTD